MNIEYLENTLGSVEPLQISVGFGIVCYSACDSIYMMHTEDALAQFI